MAAALVALVATAAISLILPIAVRRVVDGFQTSAVALLDSYFLAALRHRAACSRSAPGCATTSSPGWASGW